MKKLLMMLCVVTLSAAVAVAQAGASGAAGSNAPGGQGSSNESGMQGQGSAVGAGQGQAAPQDQTQLPEDQNKSSKHSKSSMSSMANVDDESLHRQVHEQLASNPDLQNVQITVNKGVVTLEGSVPKKGDRKEAARLAKSVPGVKKVKDKLSINASASAAAPSSTGGVSAAATGENANAQASSSQGQANAGAVAGQTGATGSSTSAAPSAGTSSEMGQSSQSGQMSQMGQASSSTANAGQPCGAAGSSAGAAAASSDVQQIQSQICAEPSLASSNVSVSEQGNQIILSGTVSSMDAKDKASDIAMKYANGKTLVNNIQVSGAAAGATPPSSGGISGQAGATATAPSAVPPAEQQQQPGISGQAGATGQTPEAGAQAGAQAGMGTASSDDQLRSQIETALRNEPTLSSSNINVNVTADKVELSGSVATGKDRQTAKRIAESFAGNRKVVDHITVSGKGNMNEQPPQK